MQRRIADIKKDISAHSARSAWDKGVKGYAVEMFDDYLDRLHITDDSVRIGKVAEADLLNGAQNWEQYCLFIMLMIKTWMTAWLMLPSTAQS